MKATRPKGLGAPGRKLWDAITGEYELSGDDLAVLEEAARTRDLIGSLRERVGTEGLLLASPQGERMHPAAVEARQQCLLLAKLLAALKLPSDVEGAA